MPPKTRITQKMIIDAALQIIRESGYEAISAKAIAEKLGCSTQPVLYTFSTVKDIKEMAYHEADLIHSAYLMCIDESSENPLLEIGIRYIQFAKEEPNLFKFLFQSVLHKTQRLETLTSAPELEPIIHMMGEATGLGVEKSAELFKMVFLLSHGIASMIANSMIEYEIEDVRRWLSIALDGFYSELEEEK